MSREERIGVEQRERERRIEQRAGHSYYLNP